MRFDIPEMPHPVTVTVCRDFREHDFALPYETEDPEDIRLLRSYPGVSAVPTVPLPTPLPETEPQTTYEPFKRPRKEVSE
ncbi:MAG: hypothetical protein V1912_00095 [bacterium]